LLRSEISRIKRKGTRLYMRLSLRVLRLLFFIFPGSRRRISIGYLTQNPRHMDGLGAQLQRVIAVRGLAAYWGLSSWQPKIQKIAIHPLDGLDSNSSVAEYIQSVNVLIDGKVLKSEEKIHYLENPGFFAILLVFLRTIVRRDHINLMLSLPFRFVDSLPDIYSLGAYNYRERLKQHITLKRAPGIAIHNRWATGSGVIQPGQNVSRSVSLDRFKSVLERRFKTLIFDDLLLFTDAPSEAIRFVPDSKAQESWTETAGFDFRGIDILGQSKQEIDLVFPDASIVRGGNPLETLANLSVAKTIVLSNSSFGYVAAILSSNSEVLIPKEFWHPPLKGWKPF